MGQQFQLNTPPSPDEIRKATAYGYAEPRRRKPHQYWELNAFARGFVEAMFWTNGDMGDEDSPFRLNEIGVEGLTVASIKKIKRECALFERKNARLLELAYSTGYEVNRAGCDFWLSRQGHGAGFFDRVALARDVWESYRGKSLRTPGARPMRVFSLQLDEGDTLKGTLADMLHDNARRCGELYVETSRVGGAEKIHVR